MEKKKGTTLAVKLHTEFCTVTLGWREGGGGRRGGAGVAGAGCVCGGGGGGGGAGGIPPARLCVLYAEVLSHEVVVRKSK